MKNKKTKLISVIFIGFFFVLIGSPFINGERQAKNLLANQYWALGTYLETDDTLNFRIESDPIGIEIYIMNEAQINDFMDNPSSGIITYFYAWYNCILLTESIIAWTDQMYYVLMINPSDSTSTYVVIDATVDEYVPKTITITNPTSINIFDVGSNYITWTSTGDIDYVKIDLYKSGVYLETITSGANNDGSYTWYISSDDYIDSSYYKIKITDYDDNSIYDYSDYFSIEEPEPYDPYDPNRNLWNTINNIIFMIVIPLCIVLAIAIPIVFVIRNKRKSPKEQIIQVRETPKITYCPECGVEITDMTKDYCSKCGGKIIK